jgi:putative iron-dependent peroxidase
LNSILITVGRSNRERRTGVPVSVAATPAVWTVAKEIRGFRYRDSRDLTGFIDGTENPKGKARAVAALIGEEDRPFAGGSYVAVQRYVHDLERWRRLDDREQEQIIGRTKRGSVECPKR